MTSQIVFRIGALDPATYEAVEGNSAAIATIGRNIDAIKTVDVDLRETGYTQVVANDFTGQGFIAALGAIYTDLVALAGIIPDIEDVADIDAETIVVAGIAANVTTVATNISDINSVVTNLSTYQTANTNLAVYQTANTNFSTIETAADNLTTYETANTNLTVYQTANTNLAVYQTANTNLSTYQTANTNFAVVDNVNDNITIIDDVNTNLSVYQTANTNFSTYQTAATNLSTYQTANTNFSVLNTVNNNTAAILAAAQTATDKAAEASGYADDAAEDAAALNEAITKLNGVEAGATADQTGAEIKAAYEGEDDTNAFTDAYKAALDSLDADLADAVSDIRGGVNADSDTLAKLRAKVETDTSAARTGAVADIRDGVNADSDTLAKLRTKVETDAGNARTGAVSDIRDDVDADSDTLAKLRTKVETDVTALDDRLTARVIGDVTRPSENKAAFTTVLSGPVKDRTPMTQGSVELVVGQHFVLEIGDEDIDGPSLDFGPAQAFAILPGRVYAIRYSFLRTQDPVSPATVSVSIKCKNQIGSLLPHSDETLVPPYSPAVAEETLAGVVLVSVDDLTQYGVIKLHPATRYTTPYFSVDSGLAKTGFGDLWLEDVTQAFGAIKTLADAKGGDATFLARLDRIEAGATDAEIKAAYEANADTNAYTDSEKSKLDGIEAGATGDQTDAEIKAAYEANDDTNAFTDDEKTKLNGVDAALNLKTDTALFDTRTNALDFGIRTGEFFPLAEDPLDTTVYPLAEDTFSGFSGFGLMGASETEILNTDGGVLFARWSDGSSSEIGNLSYPTAGTTLFEGFLQTEIVCPWVDVATQYAARWQLTWDEFSNRTSNAITRVGKDLYAWQGNGQPVLLRLEDGAARSAENGSWADFTLIDGQSLATNRTGPSRNASAETWGTVLRFGANPDSKIKMLGTAIQGAANSTEGTDTNLENIATATIADAIATPVGSSVDINDGNPLQAESAFMVNAMAQTLSEVGTRDGRWNVLNALAMGGQEITHFLQTSSGGQNDYWVGAWVPYIERLGAIVGKTPKNFSNFFIQGTKDHEDDMDEATYRGYLDDLYTDRKGVVETNLSGVTYRMIQPPVHKIYSTSATPPAGYSSYQASAIAAAQLNKGLSDDAGDAAYYSAPPFYNITFSGISHPTDNGYLMLQSMLGFVSADIKRYEDAGGNEKWKPPHVTSAVLASDNRSMTVTIHATPYLGPIEVLAPSDPSPTKGLPKKDGWGFNAYGGTAPDIDAIEVLNEDQVKITFDAAWTGTGRSLGVAWESPASGRTFLSYYPGWQSSDGDPLGTGDTWVHNGVGSNIMRRTHWRNIVTGEPIHAYLPSQLISIAD